LGAGRVAGNKRMAYDHSQRQDDDLDQLFQITDDRGGGEAEFVAKG
jgi:hypothetical protein